MELIKGAPVSAKIKEEVGAMLEKSKRTGTKAGYHSRRRKSR